MIRTKTVAVSLTDVEVITCMPSPEDVFPIITVCGLGRTEKAMPYLMTIFNRFGQTSRRCQDQ